MASAIERLSVSVATYMTLSSERDTPPENLNQLKMQISELLYSVPEPQRTDEEEVRAVYNAALEILTTDNSVIVADPVPLSTKVVTVITNVSSAASDSIKKVAHKQRELLYLGGAAAMYYFGGLPGAILVATLYAMDRVNAAHNPQARIVHLDPSRGFAPQQRPTDEVRLID